MENNIVQDIKNQWFIYGNSIHVALDNKDIKLAKKFLGEWFKEFTKLKGIKDEKK